MQHLTMDMSDRERTDQPPSEDESLPVVLELSGLAELSATLAHDVNQPLAAIVANAHACFRWLSADPPNLDRARLAAQRIIRDANHASDVVGQFRGRYRKAIAGDGGTTTRTSNSAEMD